MSRKQVSVCFYISYYYKIHQMHDSDILMLKIGIPDKNNHFATLHLPWDSNCKYRPSNGNRTVYDPNKSMQNPLDIWFCKKIQRQKP